MQFSSFRRTLKLIAAGISLGWTLPAGAQVALERGSPLHLLTFESSRLSLSPDIAPLDQARDTVRLEADAGFAEFVRTQGGSWVAYVDRRTGQIEYFEGSGIPWVPGRGNDLPLDAAVVGNPSSVDLAVLDQKAREFFRVAAPLFGIDASHLRLNPARSTQPADHVWFVDYDVLVDGLVVEGARVVFTVNNGNLISVGSENLPAPGSRAPAVKVGADEARKAVVDYIGGLKLGDRWIDSGSYHLLPANRIDPSRPEGFEPGRGRELVGVWQFLFHRPGELGTFRARVDAATGELLEFVDVNEYGSATGGTYRSDRPASEVVLPLPFADVAAGVYTNSAGIFSGTSGTTTLSGQYVRVVDSCGSISKSADASGVIALGTSGGTDCTTPGTGGAGNTHAARTQFYMLNRAKEVARGWLPSNSWLNAQLRANTNLNQTCNAYWNGSTVNFFRSGGGCANTGELPGVSLHEYGHGIDSNDGNGSSPDNGTGETYGDWTAALATHSSCIGNGFLGSNCGGYGNSCTSCTGVRDIDWAKHSRNTPSTVANFTQTTCPQPSSYAPNYVGPCGKDAIARSQTSKKREGHCESYVSSEALWDMVNRDHPSPGSAEAWTWAERLWYLSRSTATAAFVCDVSGTTWTSHGCATGSLFRVFRAVDDDNGNLADGTPHGGAIAAAFNRHGIACTTDAGWNTTYRAVARATTPSLTVTAGNNSATLSWSGSSGVYDIYRNEAGCNAGFTKIANDVSGTSYTDSAVANGITYYYQITAQPSGNESAASAPSTCLSVTPTGGGGGCTPPAAPTGVTASASSATAINLSWSASSGATSYKIFRSTTSGSGYTQVGTSTGTSFADSGLSCNTTYYYVVSASNGTCDSGYSAQASATTQACSGGTLTNGVPVTGISGATGSEQRWTMSVPSGASNLKFQISGGTGDADLYVKFGTAPTTTTYDCRPYLSGNDETCSFATPAAGTWHVMIRGYSTYSGVTLVGSYSTGPTCNNISDVEPNNSRSAPQSISGSCNQIAGTFANDPSTRDDYFMLSLPAGKTVTALLNGLSVDYDLYIYNSLSGSSVASSTNSGTTADQASWTNTGTSAQTVYIRVYQYSSTKTNYQLKISY